MDPILVKPMATRADLESITLCRSGEDTKVSVLVVSGMALCRKT